MDWEEDRDSREEELSMLRRLGSSVESKAKRGGDQLSVLLGRFCWGGSAGAVLTKQSEQRLQSEVQVPPAGLLPRLQHHLLLADLTQVKT